MNALEIANPSPAQILLENLTIDLDRTLQGEGFAAQCDGGSPGLESQTISPWAQSVLADAVCNSFRETSFFSISRMRKAKDIMHEARLELGLPAHPTHKLNFAILESLHCVSYEEMSQDVLLGLKPAVWDALGIDHEVGPVIFGKYWDQVLAASPPARQEHKMAESTAGCDNLSSCPSESAIQSDEVNSQPRPGWIRRLLK